MDDGGGGLRIQGTERLGKQFNRKKTENLAADRNAARLWKKGLKKKCPSKKGKGGGGGGKDRTHLT
jgi:hypothetical protein